MLRIAHGDVYTKEKLHRFSLADNDKCPRCDGVETLRHKFIECPYVKRIWARAKDYIIKLSEPITGAMDVTQVTMSTAIGNSLASMTLNAEILQTILYLNPDQNFLIHPKNLVHMALKNLARKEGNVRIKRQFIALLNETNDP